MTYGVRVRALLIAILMCGCWTGGPVTYTSPELVVRARRPAPVKRPPDCGAQLEALAAELDHPAIEDECDYLGEDYWYCAFVARIHAWDQLNAQAWYVVQSCTPEVEAELENP